MTFVFASNNAHKLEEVRAIVPTLNILSLSELGCHEDIPETQPTLEGNSLQKAEYVRDWCLRHPEALPTDLCGCFADDTGLEIEALHGEPGVYTARWAGEACDPAQNRLKALRLLQGETNRKARFRTIVTLLQFDSAPLTFEVIVRGYISTEERGDHGFGYDAVFIPAPEELQSVPSTFGLSSSELKDRTFAELPAELKNSISHRARAMHKLAEYITNI